MTRDDIEKAYQLFKERDSYKRYLKVTNGELPTTELKDMGVDAK